MKIKIIKIIFMLFLVLTVTLSVRPFPNVKNNTENNTNGDSDIDDLIYDSADELLPNIKNADMLINKLRTNNQYYYMSDMGGVVTSAPKGGASNFLEESSNNSSDFSKTNIQVDGVDEADIIKTDGRYIYYINNTKVTIVDAINPSSLKIVSKIELDKYETPSEMYIDGNKMVLISNYYSGADVMYKEAMGTMPNIIWAYENNTIIRVYNITDKSNIILEKDFTFDGHYNTSRKIGNYLYVIGNKYSYYFPGDYDKKENADQEINVDKYLPMYKDSTKGDTWERVNIEDIKYFPDDASNSFLCLTSIDISNPDKPANFKTYLGNGYTVYASTKSLYVVGTVYKQNEAETVVKAENVPDSDSKVSSDTGANAEEPVSTSRAGSSDYSDVIYTGPETAIYKFWLNDGEMKCVANGTAPGSIINQFSMDESDGYFRIATTTYKYDSQWRNVNSNNVYVFDNNLKQVGKLENLAIGENIYSVRFMGSKAYLVTFKVVDPLFVIDLSNPKEPRVLGELKIPGYSNYLHPYDENHIIGFGMSTSDIDENFAITQGMKIAMFDVTDLNNPKEMFKVEIGDRGTYSQLLYNHKALLFSKEKNLIAFPVNVHENKNKNKNSDIFAYPTMTFQGMYVYNFDMKKGFTLRGKVSHFSKGELDKIADTYYYNAYDYTKEIQRGVYIGDTLITVSNKKIVSTNLRDMSLLDEVVL